MTVEMHLSSILETVSFSINTIAEMDIDDNKKNETINSLFIISETLISLGAEIRR